MVELPMGTVTFLFTDLEGSTRMWESHPEEMKAALARHDSIVLGAIAEHDGIILSAMGDGFAAVFASAPDAVAGALDAQLGLAAELWGEAGPLRARMGLHSDEGRLRAPGEYVNRPLNRCARLMGVAHGGQVVMSDATAVIVRDALPPEGSLLDLGEHRLRDLVDSVRVFQLSHPKVTSTFPPLRSLDALPGNLPRQVTTFVGRAAELAALSQLVVDRPLVTLTGVGGVGKTRLALQVAAEVLPSFRDGVWLCELAPVSDPGAVSRSLASALGVEPAPGRDLEDVVLDHLASRHLLLVLDNCEHLLDRVARVVSDIAQRCPEVAVLATSREGLAVSGEQIVAVPSLPVPATDVDLTTLADADAVRLFVDRAHDAQSDFVLTDRNADAVAQLCRRLDGIPLALELAAARVRSLTPEDLVARLDQRFKLLTRGTRAALERHQTLRHTIDWSYELLSESERDALSRLSVFSDGCDLDAAEAVLPGGALDALDVAAVLGQLVDKSLVGVTAVAGARYVLLETIKQYADERLVEKGEAQRYRREHAHYFTRFVEMAVPRLWGLDEIEWTERIDRELDNIRTAMNWAIADDDADTALRILSSSCDAATPWCSLFNPTIAPMAQAALNIMGTGDHVKLPAALAAAAFLILVWQQDYDLASRLATDALEVEQRLGTRPVAYPWVVHANVAMASGGREDYVELWERGLEVMRTIGSPELASDTAFVATMRASRGEDATEMADEALVLARHLGAPGVIAIALAAVSLAYADSDPTRSMASAREAMEMERRRGPHGGGNTFAILSDVVGRHGTTRERLEMYRDVMERMEWIGTGPPRFVLLANIADLLAAEDPDAAGVIYGGYDASAAAWQLTGDRLAERDAALAVIRDSLGADRLTALRADGGAMTESELVAHARAAIDRYLRAN